MQTYFWLDDNPDRSVDANNMQLALKVKVNFFDLKEADLEEMLTSLVAKCDQPSLIILDQNLENADRGIFIKGSTVAAYLRESWPTCPIICITGEDVHNLNSQQKSLYEEVFSISRVSEYYQVIESIANGFELINAAWPKEPKSVVNLLKGPKIDFEKLVAVLPTPLKDSLNDKSAISEISRWVREILMKRPGFLYDKMWVSTLLGIKEDSFLKIEEFFATARYRGVFAIESAPRWWKSTVIEVLYDLSELPGLPWEKGRGIQRVTEADYSQCYVSGEDFPETIAFIDQSLTPIEKPIKLKYTQLHPDYEKLLYFEDIRLMKGDE